jgi:antirestriction protein ArdC
MAETRTHNDLHHHDDNHRHRVAAMTTTKPNKTKASSRHRNGPSAEELLVADLVALMETTDLPPWRREWSGHNGEHRNLETRQPYRGANPILLELGGMLRGHTLPLWIGASQAKAHGWFPRKGSKAVRIVRPQLNKRELTGEDGQVLMLPDGSPSIAAWVSYKPVPVFNAGDLVGNDDTAQQKLEARISQAIRQQDQKEPQARLEAAETVLESWTVPTSWGGARACYSPMSDQIRMPHPEAFTSREAFCATWAHEQAHSTGHARRLDRPMGGSFGSSAYAREELVAELAAVLICYRLQIGCQLANHAAYLKEWAQLLREQPRTLFKVLSDARQAADLIAPETGAEIEGQDPASAQAA